MKRINKKTNKPFRRGDLDDNGNSFWCYQKNILRDDGYFGETWIEREKIELYERLLENGYEKRCTKCGELKTAKGGFCKKLSSDDGFDPWCIDCFLKKNRKWVEENHDRQSYLTTRWYSENADKHLANSRKNYSENKARRLLDYWRREERVAQATPSWVRKEDLLPFYEEAARLTEETGIPHEVDHIHPLVHKRLCGLNVPCNLQVITREENRKKANKFDISNI